MSSTITNSTANPKSFKQLVLITVLGCLSMIGFDFLFNAGILAKLWKESWDISAFLPPEKVAQFIPFTYLAFYLDSVLLVWLMRKLEIAQGIPALIFGLKIGALLSAAGSLGIVSIFPVNYLLVFLGWFIGNTMLICVCCLVIGFGLASKHLGRLSFIVIGSMLLIFVVIIMLQSLGIIPSLNIES